MAIKYVTVSGAGTNSGNDWNNAYAFSDFISFLSSGVAAGDTIYIEEGTYTATANRNWYTAGSKDLNIRWIGVKSGTTAEPPTVSDYASGTARPLFANGAYTMLWNSYWSGMNLRFTGTASYVLSATTYSRFVNMSFSNTSGTASRNGFQTGGVGNVFIDCEFESTNGSGLSSIHADHTFYNSYIHDSAIGISITSQAYHRFINCIFDTCNTGLSHSINSAALSTTTMNCTFYNCTTGLNLNNNSNSVVYNCIFSDNGTGASTDGTGDDSIIADYNNFYNNTSDRSNFPTGVHDTTNNPSFEDAAGGDFRLASGSSCRNAGAPLLVGV